MKKDRQVSEVKARLGLTIITYHRGPDSHGRYHFTLEWWQKNGVFFDEQGKVLPDVTAGPKAQVFLTDPCPMIAQCRERGEEVREIDQRERR